MAAWNNDDVVRLGARSIPPEKHEKRVRPLVKTQDNNSMNGIRQNNTSVKENSLFISSNMVPTHPSGQVFWSLLAKGYCSSIPMLCDLVLEIFSDFNVLLQSTLKAFYRTALSDYFIPCCRPSWLPGAPLMGDPSRAHSRLSWYHATIYTLHNCHNNMICQKSGGLQDPDF